MRRDREPKHLAAVRELPCGLCGAAGPSFAHHILTGRVPGRRCADELAIPLCYECHQGTQGIHGDRTLWTIYKKDELMVLADTIRKLMRYEQ